MRAFIETPDEAFMIEGRLDAYGLLDAERVMLAIAQPDTPGGGQVHMLGNTPDTRVTMELLG